MLSKIPLPILEFYKPLSPWEAFYLRTRWRLCPYELLESFLPKRGKILDFGCGYGLFANLLALRSPDRYLVGIDLNRKRIAVASRSVKNRTNITFQWGDVGDLHSTPFDAVVMTDVLHHIDDSKAGDLLGKINALLHSEGILAVLDVDNRPFWKFLTTYLIDRLLNPGDLLWYRSLNRMTNLLNSSFLRIDTVIRVHKDLPLSDILYLCRKGHQ